VAPKINDETARGSTLNPNSAVGRDGALRRPRAVTGAERMSMNAAFAQFFPTAERGRGQRSALSLPPLSKELFRNSGSINGSAKRLPTRRFTRLAIGNYHYPAGVPPWS